MHFFGKTNNALPLPLGNGAIQIALHSAGWFKAGIPFLLKTKFLYLMSV